MKRNTVKIIIGKQLFLLSLLLLMGCNKDAQLETQTPKIVAVHVEPQTTQIAFKWIVTYPGMVSSVVKLSLNGDMSDADTIGYDYFSEFAEFSATAKGLKKGTSYYYCFVVTNPGLHCESEVDSVSTLTDIPTVKTVEVTDVAQYSAKVAVEVSDDSGLEVTERGVCYGFYNNPTIDDDHIQSGSGLGAFTVTLTELFAGMRYYVRAYATNSQGTAYGEQMSFETASGLPGVITSEITDIEWRSAKGGGEVLSEGGAEITQIGLCWATSHDPDVTGNHINLTYDYYIFTANITDLLPNTTYYVRAYAKNSYGVSYGDEKSFTTKASQKPIVATGEISAITSSSATVNGEVTSDGGETVTERGVYYGTSPNPSATGTKVSASEGGIGSFACSLTGLNENSKYYVCAFATNSQGTSYGEDVSFTTPMVGALGGVFSVSATQKVYFSHGNLQYKATTNTWRFAENQWDRIGTDNSHISQTYSGWIDLFGWGTSGYDHGAICYQPWSISYRENYYYAYGSASYALYDQTGQADWGYNAIVNGGNQENSGWRTLTKDEWTYVLFTRPTDSGIRYAMGCVNGINGIIIVPDDWDANIYSLNNTNATNTSSFNDNIINSTQWSVLEQHGVAFLPVGGRRQGTAVEFFGLDGEAGLYWSSSNNNDSTGDAFIVLFQVGVVEIWYYPINYGLPVRLVHNVE